MKKMKTKTKYVVLILIPILLLPMLISAISLPVLASSNIEDESDSWLKGIIFLILSFVINNFISDEAENKEKQDTDKQGETGSSPLIDEKEKKYEVLGFYVNWLTKYANSQKAVEKHWQNLDKVVPFWYTLKPDGKIENRYGGHQYELSSLTDDRKIDMLPLINNSQKNNMMLVNPEIRNKSVNNIVKLIEKYDYKGINIDFEFIPEWTRNGYTSFIKLLSEKMPADKILTISVFPKINVPLNLQGAYDYSALAKYVDQIVIMTYDNHWSTGPAGPIAPINWVENNIQYALEYIPADKIMLGIANYGYDWTNNNTAQDISAKKAIDIASKKGVEIKWHESYQTPYFYYRDENNIKHEVWFENSYSTSFKLELVKKYDLKGIAIWRLGNSTDKFWETINKNLNL